MIGNIVKKAMDFQAYNAPNYPKSGYLKGILQMAEYSSIKVTWPAISSADTRLNGKEEFELEVAPDLSGLLDVWACPACEAYPAGYWYNLDTEGRYYDKAEPGCDSNDKVLLCSIRFSDVTAPSKDGDTGGGSSVPVVEFCHPDVKLDMDELKANESVMTQNA